MTPLAQKSAKEIILRREFFVCGIISTVITGTASSNNTYCQKYLYFSTYFHKVSQNKIFSFVSQLSILILVTFSTQHNQEEYLTSGTVFKSIATGGCTEYLDVSV